MAQHDYIIDNQSGAAFRADLNVALSAIVTNNSGATAPTTTYAYQWWADTTTGLLKIRNAANSAWITVGTLASTNLGLLPNTGGTLTGDLTLNAQSDLRFADADSSNWVAFQSPATVTSNVTWTLPSADGTDGQKLTTNGSGTLSWTRNVPNVTLLTSGTGATYTPTTGTKAIYVEVVGGGGGGGGCDGQGAGTNAGGTGGGGGGYSGRLITNMSQTFTYTVGSGGGGGVAGANNGSNGGTSTFTGSVSGAHSATGGTGGAGHLGSSGSVLASGSDGGSGSGGDLNLDGSCSTSRGLITGNVSAASLSGAAPFFAGSIRTSPNTGNGLNAVNFGAGGSPGQNLDATATNYAGGNGKAGVIRITEYF